MNAQRLGRDTRFGNAATHAALSAAYIGTLTVCATVFISGCAKGPPIRPAASVADDAPIRFFSPPISLAAPEDAIVRIVGPQASCSGTLIDDDLVLTAHHCVAAIDTHGKFSKGIVPPSSLHVELGGDYLAWGTVRVTHIIAPPCGEAGGGGDIAVLVLERKIIGLGAMTPRLDAPPRMSEPLDAAGFGRCAMSADGIKRNVREGGNVTAVFPQTITFKASICPGDSGGPVFAHGTHEVVGVVSMSAMDGDDRTTSPSLMARIDAFHAVFANARLIADGIAESELPPISCPAEKKPLAPAK
ncbi:MAG: S1 family peptidase [Polyangiaceae bacterium]